MPNHTQLRVAPLDGNRSIRAIIWRSPSAAVVLLALCAAILGCAKKPPVPAVAEVSKPPIQAVDPSIPPKPVYFQASNKEAEELATAFAAAMSAGDLDTALAYFDFSAFAALATAEASLKPPASGDVAQRLQLAQQMGSAGVEALLQSQSETASPWRLLHVRRREEHSSAIVRTIGQSGLRYYELLIARVNDSPRVIDMWVFTTGERLTGQIARWMHAGGNPAPDQNLTPAQRMQRLLERAVQTQNYALALEIFAELPEAERQELGVQRLRLQAAQATSPEAGQTALEELIQLYPEDAGVALQAIAIRQEQQRYSAALGSIDLVDRAVGGDPYLNVLRAQAFRGDGDFIKARERIAQAIEAEPDLQEAYWERVMISLAEKNYADTARALEAIRGRFAVTFLALETIPDYAGFVASPEYQAWRAANPKPQP